MTNQQIIDCRGCTIPLRQSQNTIVNVKGSSGAAAMLYHKVLGGKQFGKVAFDLLSKHGVVRRCTYYIRKKGDPKTPL